ncbi:hypothetical protein C8Q73DRAFT_705121 [Cubamyces lactineus]|nr:hypothetical protein C8Q73DRAFT_705121 [Cubamyces lactineus]
MHSSSTSELATRVASTNLWTLTMPLLCGSAARAGKPSESNPIHGEPLVRTVSRITQRAADSVRNGGKLAREAGLKPRDHGLLFYLLPRGCSIWTSEDEIPGGLIIPFHQSSTDAFYEPEFHVVVKEYRRLLESKDKAALDQAGYRGERCVGSSQFNTAVLRWCCQVAEKEGAEEEDKIRERRAA